MNGNDRLADPTWSMRVDMILFVEQKLDPKVAFFLFQAEKVSIIFAKSNNSAYFQNSSYKIAYFQSR
jgi:hypothetical protein